MSSQVLCPTLVMLLPKGIRLRICSLHGSSGRGWLAVVTAVARLVVTAAVICMLPLSRQPPLVTALPLLQWQEMKQPLTALHIQCIPFDLNIFQSNTLVHGSIIK